MKISQLNQIPQVSREIQIPISIAGQNMHVTAGQLIDTLPASIVAFNEVDTTADPVIAEGSTSVPLPIVYHVPSGNFYLRRTQTSTNAGITTTTTTLYTQWDGRSRFYATNTLIRTDCLFITAAGELYKHNGHELIAAGMLAEEREALKNLQTEMAGLTDSICAVEFDREQGRLYAVTRSAETSLTQAALNRTTGELTLKFEY